MNLKISIAIAGHLAITLSLGICAPAFSRDLGTHSPDDCGYYMCGYEKEHIDTVILGHARECQTVMFGEIHDSVAAGAPAISASSKPKGVRTPLVQTPAGCGPIISGFVWTT